MALLEYYHAPKLHRSPEEQIERDASILKVKKDLIRQLIMIVVVSSGILATIGIAMQGHQEQQNSAIVSTDIKK